MLTALVRLRGALQEARLPLELPGADEQRACARGDGRPARGLRHPAPDDPRRAAARGRRRLDRRRQVDAGQLARRHPRHHARRAAPDDPLARCWCTTPTTRSGSARTGCCPSSSGSTARPTTPTRCSWSPSPAMPPGLADPRRPRHRLGRGAQPRAGRPAARRRRPVALRHLGRALRRPGAVGLPAQGRRALGRRRDRARPHPARRRRDDRHPPRPDAGQPRPQGLPAVHRRRRARSPTRGCCRSSSVDRDPAVARARWPTTRRPARPSSSRPSTARSAPWPVVPTRSPTPPPSRSTPYAACARTPTTAYDRAVDRGRRGVGRRHPAARRGAGALAGVRRHRRAAQVARDPGRLDRATGSSTPSRASPSRPSGSPSRSSPASRR